MCVTGGTRDRLGRIAQRFAERLEEKERGWIVYGGAASRATLLGIPALQAGQDRVGHAMRHSAVRAPESCVRVTRLSDSSFSRCDVTDWPAAACSAFG